MRFIKKIKNVFASPSQPLVKVLVFKNQLLENFRILQKIDPKAQIAPVFKSNAYGHGLAEVAKIFNTEQIPFFVVDSFYEAVVLKKAGIKKNLLVIGYSFIEHISKLKSENISFAIVSMEQLRDLSQNLKQRRKFHLKIDTGMHRQGILPEELNEAVLLIKSNSNIILEGVCSHLADADSKNENFTRKQIQEWNFCIKKLKNIFSEIKYWHLANSAGIKFSKNIDANIIRPGIALYGYDQSGIALGLKPALELKTVVSGFKDIRLGETVGYNNTFKAERNSKIATLPVGYYEGLDRRLSNLGFVKIGKVFCRVTGRVSMNITAIEIPETLQVTLNQEATIIGRDSGDLNSVQNIADLCHTIPYEILVHIPAHLRREVV